MGAGAAAIPLGNAFWLACFGAGPSCAGSGGRCFEVVVAEGGSGGCGRTAGGGSGGLAGVVGVVAGSPINGGVVPLKKPLGIPFGVVGGAFSTMVLSEAGRCGSCSHNAPCT